LKAAGTAGVPTAFITAEHYAHPAPETQRAAAMESEKILRGTAF
jgi:hypothetical protein